MTHKLQPLLGIIDDEMLFQSGLALLEKTTGNSGIDVKLIAEILSKAHDIMRQLGLRPDDTSGSELYHALLASVDRVDFETLLENADDVLVNMDGKVISFNIVDVAANAYGKVKFGEQIVSSGQRCLRGELMYRYLRHKRTDSATTLDIAFSIGLLRASDKWYNNDESKHNQKQPIAAESGSK